MVRKLAVAAAALTMTLGSAHAQPASRPARACLMMARIYNWSVLPDKRTLIVEDLTHRKFRVTLMGPCPGLNFNVGLGFQSRGGTQLGCLSRGDVVVHRGFGAGNRCIIRSVEAYTPAMQKADQAAGPASH